MVLVAGTLFLTWHSRPNRVSRAILWRSALIRRICATLTGLHFSDNLTPSPLSDGSSVPPRTQTDYQTKASLAASAAAKRRPDAPGVKFTFILYENQRRWVGLGWTTSLFAYERAAWTDEHLNFAPAKEDFELPDVEGGAARWRWVEGSKWLVEGAGEFDEGGIKAKPDATDGGQGWIYYDNKWQNGRRGQDGWGRYTRRRKWYRDAELVEVSPSTEITPSPTPTRDTSPGAQQTSTTVTPIFSSSFTDHVPDYLDKASIKSGKSKAESFLTNKSDGSSTRSSGFKGRPAELRRRGTGSSLSIASDDDRPLQRPRESDYIADDVRMGLE